MKNCIKLFGFFVTLYSVAWLFAHSIGPGGSEADTFLEILINWLPIVLFISGIGISKLKKWSWYTTLIIMSYFTIDNLKYYKGDLGYFLRDMHVFFIFPLVVIVFLLMPEVKKQFK